MNDDIFSMKEHESWGNLIDVLSSDNWEENLKKWLGESELRKSRDIEVGIICPLCQHEFKTLFGISSTCNLICICGVILSTRPFTIKPLVVKLGV